MNMQIPNEFDEPQKKAENLMYDTGYCRGAYIKQKMGHQRRLRIDYIDFNY